jgi:hypothetical protein
MIHIDENNSMKETITKYGLEHKSAATPQEIHNILKDTASKGLLLLSVAMRPNNTLVFTRTKETVDPSLVEPLMDSIDPTP